MPLSLTPIATVGPVGAVVLPISVLLFWLPYERRSRTLARDGRPVPGWRKACFAAGLIVLAGAVSPPVDNLSDELLAVHMVEHLLIGDIAALLIVLGFTGPLLAPLLRTRWVGSLRVLTHPVVAIVLWGANFYAWHIPYLYQAALRHDVVHAVEHATFLGFGIAVWMALIGPLPKPVWFSNSWRLVYIIAVRLVGTVLANAMVFAGTVFYPYYRAGDALHHISPLTDQITAGAVMMVEESLLTIGLFCWLFLKVAREGEERQRILDFASSHGIELAERRAARAVAAGRGEELWRRLRAAAGSGEAAAGLDDLDEGEPVGTAGDSAAGLT